MVVLPKGVVNFFEKLQTRNKKVPPETTERQDDLFVISASAERSSDTALPNVEPSAIKPPLRHLGEVLTGSKCDVPINNLDDQIVVDSTTCCVCSPCCGSYYHYSECASFHSVSSPTGMESEVDTPKNHHDASSNHPYHGHHNHHGPPLVHAYSVAQPTDLHAALRASPDLAHSHHRHGHHARSESAAAVIDLESALRRMGFGARYGGGATDDDNLLNRIPNRFLHKATTASLDWEAEWIRLLQLNNNCAFCAQMQQASPGSNGSNPASSGITRPNSVTSLGSESSIPCSVSILSRHKQSSPGRQPESILSTRNREFFTVRKSSLVQQLSNASVSLKTTILCVDDLNLDIRKPSRAPKLGRKHVSFDVEIIELEKKKLSIVPASPLVAVNKEPNVHKMEIAEKRPSIDVCVQTELNFGTFADESPSPPDFCASSLVSTSSASSSPSRQGPPAQGHSFTSDSSGYAEDPTPSPIVAAGLESPSTSTQRLDSSTSTASTIQISTSPRPDLFKLTFTTLDSEESAKTLTPGDETPPASRRCSAQERRDQYRGSKSQRFAKSSPAPVERKLKRRRAIVDQEDLSISMPHLNDDVKAQDFDQVVMLLGKSEQSEEVFLPVAPLLERTRSNSEPVMNWMALELIKRTQMDPVAGSDVEDYYASSVSKNTSRLVRSEMENLERILLEARTQIQGLEAAAWANQEPLQPQLSLGTRMTLESVRVTRLDLITELRRLQKNIQNRQKHLLSDDERQSRLRAYQALNVFGSCSGSNFQVNHQSPHDAMMAEVGGESPQVLTPEDPCHCTAVLAELQELRAAMQEQREILLKLSPQK